MTPADLLVRENDLSKSWSSMARDMFHEHYSTGAHGSPVRLPRWDYVVDCQSGT